MLPLEVKASIRQLDRTTMLKVAGVAEIASAAHPFDRMALDVRALPPGALSNELMDLPWGGFVCDEASPPHQRPTIVLQGEARIAAIGDVIEADPVLQRVAIRYRRGDNGNVLFATERCNSYCLMCSQPPREVEDNWRVGRLCDLVDLIDRTEPSLAISGGEPTLLGHGLVRVIEKCAAILPDTHLHILSNGRRLNDIAYSRLFQDVHPHLTWGIPLYGDHYRLHDYVVQREGAFAETLRGLYSLSAARQRIEIRVVLVKPSFDRLPETARFIRRNLPFVEHVALMGIEPIGFAKGHYQALWADPADYKHQLLAAVDELSRSGIAVSLYNLPLCVLPRKLWPFAQRSISAWKNEYLDVCSDCSVKSACGGFFSWVTPKWTSRAIKPIREANVCRMH